MATGCQGGYYAITFWVPQFLTKERHLSIVGSTGYLAALIIGSFIGYLVGAWLADRIGRRNLFLIFSLGAIAVVLLYTQLPLTNEILWVLGFPLGFFASGYFSGIGAFLTELYPTRLRGSGQGFCYNFGRGIGALFPFLVGALSNSTIARQRDRDLRGGGLRPVLHRRLRAAGNARAHIARGCLRRAEACAFIPSPLVGEGQCEGNCASGARG